MRDMTLSSEACKLLKDGYVFESQENVVSGDIGEFEKKLSGLLVRSNAIKSPINAAPIGKSIDEHNHDSNVWINDVEIFYNKYLTNHPLSKRIHTILFHRNNNAFSELKGILESIQKDTDFIESIKIEQRQVNQDKVNNTIKYDLFISHANKDKMGLVVNYIKHFQSSGLIFFMIKNLLSGAIIGSNVF